MSETEWLRSSSAEATEALGQTIAGKLIPGDIVLLEGRLAAGKTTLVRGLLCGLGGDPNDVSSPSFVILQSYPCSAWGISCLHHVDLYRVGDSISDLREVGIEEVLSDPAAVVAVEWPKDVLARWVPDDARAWRVRLDDDEDGARSIEILPP